MNNSQRRLLHKVAPRVHDAMSELDPRVIEPSKEKQKALSVAEATLLFRVGAYRVITAYPVDDRSWNLKEFDSESGELVMLRDETSKVAEKDVPIWILAATIVSIEEQLASYKANGFSAPAHEEASPVIARQLAVLQVRRTMANANVGGVAVAAIDDYDDFDD